MIGARVALLSVAASVAGIAGAAGMSACAANPRMCNSQADCASQSACVAGRCLRDGATAAVATAERRVLAPDDIGYIARGWSAAGPPRLATLGRGDGAVALLRFSMALDPDASVLEAYLLLDRPPVAVDLVPMTLHAVAITEPWDGASVTFAHRPAFEEVGTPVTRVPAASGTRLRLDVRALVQRWRERRKGEFGLAIVSEGTSPTGVPIVLQPVPGPWFGGDVALSLSNVAASPVDPAVSAQAAEVAGAPEMPTLKGPELELYVK